jgi:hypothetical protein
MRDSRKKRGGSVAGHAATPARERTIEVSASDADVILESSPPATQRPLTIDARRIAANEPTDPGVFRRRLDRRRSIALALAGGLGVVVLVLLVLTVRGFVHRTPVAASGPPLVSAISEPAPSSSPSPPPSASSAPEAIAGAADSVTAPPKDQPPPTAAPAKSAAPRTRPARPKHR